MRVESFSFEAQVVKDDGTRSSVVLQRLPDGSTFAGADAGPQPTRVRPDEGTLVTLCEAIVNERREEG